MSRSCNGIARDGTVGMQIGLAGATLVETAVRSIICDGTFETLLGIASAILVAVVTCHGECNILYLEILIDRFRYCI